MAFNNLVGNSSAKEILTNSVKDGRISHSYIFSGPPGVGKKLFALEFARLINCESGMQENCKCGSCSKIERIIHPDVSLLEYEGEKTIKIDHVRSDLEERVYLSPFESSYKIFIVDNAERMNNNAQNAFLKTLEEPPTDSVIILITQSINFIIPTIKSRCQIVNFSPLEDNHIKTILLDSPSADKENIDEAVRLSRGSVGKALNIDSQHINFRKSVLKKLHSIRPDRPSGIFSLYDMLELDSKDKGPEHLKDIFGIISDWVRDQILIKIETDKSRVTNTGMYEEIAEYVSNKSLAGLLKKPEHLESSWYGITVLNANKKLAFEDLMIKLSS